MPAWPISSSSCIRNACCAQEGVEERVDPRGHLLPGLLREVSADNLP